MSVSFIISSRWYKYNWREAPCRWRSSRCINDWRKVRIPFASPIVVWEMPLPLFFPVFSSRGSSYPTLARKASLSSSTPMMPFSSGSTALAASIASDGSFAHEDGYQQKSRGFRYSPSLTSTTPAHLHSSFPPTGFVLIVSNPPFISSSRRAQQDIDPSCFDCAHLALRHPCCAHS